MKTEKAIERIKAFRDYLCGGNPIWDVDECKEAFDIAIAAMEQRWIPVSERMPEEKKQVLVCDAYGFIYTAECEVISDDEWLDWRWYESVEYRPMDDVVAWMPLPEPWKGEEDG